LGRIELALLTTIRLHGKPITFADIRSHVNEGRGVEPGAKLRLAFERSMRRALHQLVSKFLLVAIGDGGPGDPLRYFIHPLVIGAMGDTPEAHALKAVLEADPGANEAALKFMLRIQAR
jgi:hypothetical protein